LNLHCLPVSHRYCLFPHYFRRRPRGTKKFIIAANFGKFVHLAEIGTAGAQVHSLTLRVKDADSDAMALWLWHGNSSANDMTFAEESANEIKKNSYRIFWSEVFLKEQCELYMPREWKRPHFYLCYYYYFCYAKRHYRLYLNIRYYWNQIKLNVNVFENLSFNISIVRIEIYVFLGKSV